MTRRARDRLDDLPKMQRPSAEAFKGPSSGLFYMDKEWEHSARLSLTTYQYRNTFEALSNPKSILEKSFLYQVKSDICMLEWAFCCLTTFVPHLYHRIYPHHILAWQQRIFCLLLILFTLAAGIKLFISCTIAFLALMDDTTPEKLITVPLPSSRYNFTVVPSVPTRSTKL